MIIASILPTPPYPKLRLSERGRSLLSHTWCWYFFLEHVSKQFMYNAVPLFYWFYWKWLPPPWKIHYKFYRKKWMYLKVSESSKIFCCWHFVTITYIFCFLITQRPKGWSLRAWWVRTLFSYLHLIRKKEPGCFCADPHSMCLNASLLSPHSGYKSITTKSAGFPIKLLLIFDSNRGRISGEVLMKISYLKKE